MAKKEPPQEYIEVLEVLNVLYDEVDGCSFYDYIFPDNQKQGEQCGHYEKPNAVYLYTDEKDNGTKRRLRRRIMLSDTWKEDYINYVEQNPSTLCSGIAYRGRANNLENAQRMYALAIDLDGVGLYELKNLLLRFGQPAENIRTLPVPTFLVMSGTGLHVYYVFEEPIDLFPNIKLQMKSLKYDLTFRMWDYKSTSKKDKVQYQSIVQGFRMVGSINPKYGVEVKAFQIGGRVTLEYLNSYVLGKYFSIETAKEEIRGKYGGLICPSSAFYLCLFVFPVLCLLFQGTIQHPAGFYFSFEYFHSPRFMAVILLHALKNGLPLVCWYALRRFKEYLLCFLCSASCALVPSRRLCLFLLLRRKRSFFLCRFISF